MTDPGDDERNFEPAEGAGGVDEERRSTIKRLLLVAAGGAFLPTVRVFSANSNLSGPPALDRFMVATSLVQYCVHTISFTLGPCSDSRIHDDAVICINCPPEGNCSNHTDPDNPDSPTREFEFEISEEETCIGIWSVANGGSNPCTGCPQDGEKGFTYL